VLAALRELSRTFVSFRQACMKRERGDR
jgi:hypothetical protein